MDPASAFFILRRRMVQIVSRSHDAEHPVLVLADQGLLSLDFGSGIAQSSMDPACPHRLCLAYTRRMMLALLFPPVPQRFLILGLGGASIPRFLLHYYSACRIDAVDCSPVVIEMARRHFLLADDPRLAVFSADAAGFVAAASPAVGYDAIFVDLFDPEAMAAPLFDNLFHVACRALLAPGGVLCVNLWSGDRRRHVLVLDALRGASPRLLLLPVAQRSNVIALVPQADDFEPLLRDAARRCADRADQLALPLARYLRELRHDPPDASAGGVLRQLWKRWLA
ncbi:MAG: hypothetical protein BWK76_06075 [Desulfobulbaceae bacterium A2]|nr:MAG: hypothetical protein BWK76_06075 [Desulfobulbaceae bacterium A2]